MVLVTVHPPPPTKKKSRINYWTKTLSIAVPFPNAVGFRLYTIAVELTFVVSQSDVDRLINPVWIRLRYAVARVHALNNFGQLSVGPQTALDQLRCWREHSARPHQARVWPKEVLGGFLNLPCSRTGLLKNCFFPIQKRAMCHLNKSIAISIWWFDYTHIIFSFE